MPATTSAEPIPLVDLRLQHEPLAGEIDAAIREVVASGAFVLGPAVTRFEAAFASLCGVSHVIGVANGTEAIELLLRALGIGRGDDVIVPAMTFIATASAVARAGARPVLVDVRSDDLLIDADQVGAARTPATRAVIGVDLYGQVAAFDDLALQRGLVVLEDAAQSQGARRGDAVAGSFGTAATTSFYPGKNLGAFGDAGAVMTDDETLATRLRTLRNHGGVRRYQHDHLGVNSRLDSIQAAVLNVKLRALAGWNEQRRIAATRYDQMLAAVPDLRLPKTAPGNEHVWHLYVIRVPERDRVLGYLNEAGIGAAIHYPAPIHLHGAFADLGHGRGDFPEAERAADEVLSLPMYPGITADQQERVVEALHQALIR